MNKKKVIKFFGSPEKLANAMGVTRHAVYMMPEQLSIATSDRILGICFKKGIDPTPLLEDEMKEQA